MNMLNSLIIEGTIEEVKKICRNQHGKHDCKIHQKLQGFRWKCTG